MSRPDVLLHVCCAPCLSRTRQAWEEAGQTPDRVVGWFYNPNIHPLIEFRRRIKAIRVYRMRNPALFPVDVDRRYGLADFLHAVANPPKTTTEAAVDMGLPPPLTEGGEGLDHASRGAGDADFPPPYARPERCRACYRMRFDTVAQAARRIGAGAWMTTLQSSREQSHALIREEGERAAKRHGVSFLYRDARALKMEPAPETLRGVYKQAYCGCVFSEADRFAGTRLHRDDDPHANDGESSVGPDGPRTP